MQSNFNILTALHEIVTAANPGINGHVYIGEPPLGNQGEDIGLKVVESVHKYLQYGVCHINIFLPTPSTGRYDLQRIDDILNILLPVVQDVEHFNVNGNYYFQWETDFGVTADPRRDNMGYYTIVLTFQTFKK